MLFCQIIKQINFHFNKGIFAQTETEEAESDEIVEEEEKNKIISSPDLVVYSVFPNSISTGK
jgi:hypothetical protein